MFRSFLAGKSRQKAAIMAGALAGVLTPLAAHASLTISLQTVPGAAGASSAIKYLTRDNTGTDVPVYVYATVKGTTSVTSGTNFQGFQYAYYNINFNNVQQAINNTLDSGTTAFSNVNTAFDFAANGSYIGSTANSGSGILAGSTTVLSDIAHARAANVPAWNNATPGPSNIYISPDGKSVSFLVETLQIKPGAFHASTIAANGQNYTKFTATTPDVTGTVGGAEYQSANWNEDSTSNISNGSAGSIKDTSTAPYGASTAGAFFEDTLSGDATDNGTVDVVDLGVLGTNFGKTAGATFAQGDFSGDGKVDVVDLGQLGTFFGQSLTGIVPTLTFAQAEALVASQVNNPAFTAAVSGVPEPASLTAVAVGGLALLGRRRRNRTV
jgi:hypothetical protein